MPRGPALVTNTSFFKVQIKRRGSSPNDIKKKLRKASVSVSKELDLLAIQVSKKMARIIDANRRRKGSHTSTNAGLAGYFRTGQGIVVTRSGRNITARIGNINELNALFPYWKVINKGGKPPKPNLGYFGRFQRPIAGSAGTQIWHGGLQGGSPWANKFLIKPQKPIPAMNYIGKTKAWLNVYWKSNIKTKILGKLKR